MATTAIISVGYKLLVFVFPPQKAFYKHFPHPKKVDNGNEEQLQKALVKWNESAWKVISILNQTLHLQWISLNVLRQLIQFNLKNLRSSTIAVCADFLLWFYISFSFIKYFCTTYCCVLRESN